MLDEEEYKQLARVHRECTRSVKAYRETHGVSLAQTPRARLMKPVLLEYRRLTETETADEGHLLKHRLSLYGATCAKCGLPLRTPAAKYCAACGHSVG